MVKTYHSGVPVEPISVYLAFYGINDMASYLKIGIAKNVKNRLGGIKTGNPLPNLWTFTAVYDSKRDALSVESALLDHMSGDSVHGEWINVHGMTLQVSEALAESLSEVASEVTGGKIFFRREEYIA
jgi:hypothetical protein